MKWLTKVVHAVALATLCGFSTANAGEGVIQGNLSVSSNLMIQASIDIGLDNIVVSNAVNGGAFVQGRLCEVGGLYASAQGHFAKAYGPWSHAEGFATRAYASGAHAEGIGTHAEGGASHAEGHDSDALGNFSHAEGEDTCASGEKSHSQGWWTLAAGEASFAAGYYSEANGNHSTAMGYEAFAQHDDTFVWASSGGTEQQRTSTTNDEFTVYAANGVRLLGGPTIVEPAGGLSMGTYTNRP